MEKILTYTVQGSGPTVLLVHGLLGSGMYWDETVERLTADHRVVTLDLLGFGNSPKPQDLAYTLEDHLDYIVATLEAIGIHEPMTVVGHSMGAILSLSLAKHYPKYVKNLVLISMPVYKNATEAKKGITGSKMVPNLMYYGPTARVACAIMCQFRPLAQKLAPYFYTAEPKSVAVDATKHTWYSYSRSMANVIENQHVLDDIMAVRVPTVVIYGKSDSVASSTNIDALELNNSRVRVVRVAGTHQLPLEQPELIAQIIATSV